MTSLSLVTEKYIPFGKYMCQVQREEQNDARALCPGTGCAAAVPR